VLEQVQGVHENPFEEKRDCDLRFPPQHAPTIQHINVHSRRERGANPLIFPLNFKFQCNLIVINYCKAGVKPSWPLYRLWIEFPLIGLSCTDLELFLGSENVNTHSIKFNEGR
jgi:hypothetical protein